jgi:hypothetical protein
MVEPYEKPEHYTWAAMALRLYTHDRWSPREIVKWLRKEGADEATAARIMANVQAITEVMADAARTSGSADRAGRHSWQRAVLQRSEASSRAGGTEMEQSEASAKPGGTEMVLGGLLCVGGILGTIASYTAAGPGETYVVLGGAIIGGAILFLRGLSKRGA